MNNQRQKTKKKLLPKPRGTRDILPPQALIYQKFQQITQEILNNAGYQPIILPTYEYQTLFTNSLGETTDVIQKEMFVFQDRKGRYLALRPEGTAGVVRLVCQNKLINPGHSNRLYYWSQMFRYERPQKGRYREFTQLGIELINAKGIIADQELLWLIKKFIFTFDLSNSVVFHWNYLGSQTAQKKYKEILQEHFKDKKEELCLDCQKRYLYNPLRLLDCKICQKENFPSYQQALEPDDLSYTKEIASFLNSLNIKHNYNQNLVRGLDYYTGLIFEVSLMEENSEAVILGGGRYDNLYSQLENIHLPSAGFSLGIDRWIDYLNSLSSWKFNFNPDILFLILDNSTYLAFLAWRDKLNSKYQVISNLEIKKSVFKNINHYSPRLVIFLGKEETSTNKIPVRDCQKKQDFLVKKEELVNWIYTYLSKEKKDGEY